MTDVDLGLSPALVAWGLAWLRVFAILRAQVLWERTLGPVWWVVAAGLAAVVVPFRVGADPGIVTAAGPLAVAAATELLLGTAVGTLASLPGHALLGASAANARVLRVPAGPLGAVTLAIVLTGVLGLGLHRPWLVALAGVDTVWPVGRPALWLAALGTDVLPTLTGALGVLLVLALALATPVLLTAAVVEVAGAVLARGPGAAGQTTRPLVAWGAFAGALVALGASWAAFPAVWSRAALPFS